MYSTRANASSTSFLLYDQVFDVTAWTKASAPNGHFDCCADSKTIFTPLENVANLKYYSSGGFANYLSSGNDEVTFCNSQTIPAKCYSVSVEDSVLNLYTWWQQSELNVFGYCCKSEAKFNAGTSIAVTDYLYEDNGNTFQVSCHLVVSHKKRTTLTLELCWNHRAG
jgi:hypothetical protein